MKILRPIGLPIFLLCLVRVAVADGALASSGADQSIAHWSGLYAGIHGGYGQGSTGWRFPFTEYYNLAAGDHFSTDPNGALFGGQLILNYQFRSIVAGVEGTFSESGITQNRVGPVTTTFPLDQFKTSVDNIGTVSGRIGYAYDKWVLYGKGGFATAEATYRAESGVPGAGVIAATQDRQNGWTAGGGLEYMLRPWAVLGLDYQYINLDGERHSTATTGTAVGLPFSIDSDDIELHTITARLNIRIWAL